MSKLTLMLNGLALKEYELLKERVTIGRRSDNDIQLDDPTISGIHAVIVVKPDNYLDGAFEVTIADFNSTNGLFINGEKVSKKRLIAGDMIRIGSHELLFDEPGGSPFDRTAVSLDGGD
ncbi:MAG: FHA domain-containing protein [Chromatiales bacterium]|nr:FHA domain-containing protein [Chromatiales bacterium]